MSNRGQRFLDETQQASLEAALSAPPRLLMAGLWTGTKVAAWISETLQRPVSDVSPVGNISSVSVGLYKDLVHNIRQLRHRRHSKHLKKT